MFSFTFYAPNSNLFKINCEYDNSCSNTIIHCPTYGYNVCIISLHSGINVTNELTIKLSEIYYQQNYLLILYDEFNTVRSKNKYRMCGYKFNVNIQFFKF